MDEARSDQVKLSLCSTNTHIKFNLIEKMNLI